MIDFGFDKIALIGAVALIVIGLWYLYRFIRGWLAFSSNRPMPMPSGL